MVIDETLTKAAKEAPVNAKTPVLSADLVEDDETKRLRALLSDTLTRLKERLAKPRCAVETVLPTTQLEHVEKERLAPSTPKAS